MLHPLRQILSKHLTGNNLGITSLCTAHPMVLETAFRGACKTGKPVLIEATCNQVNQYGGYTGMQPADFTNFLQGLVEKTGLQPDQLILGGDHLGPSPWQALPAAEAMNRAETMITAFVHAGFTKIHLDCSMHLGGDDSSRVLPPELVAERSTCLAAAAEAACLPGRELVYVIGTEVPVPGGARDHHGLEITTPQAADETIKLTRDAFFSKNLLSAWERVIAEVVQPGVEFGDDFVIDFDPTKAGGLSDYIERQAGLVFEAHSTDYQTGENLQKLVEGHFAILKVGPELTFAYREAIFNLAQIEREWIEPKLQSNLIETIESVMMQHPENWQKYYHGSLAAQAFARKYSLSDRIRYYWPQPEIQTAMGKMIANLKSKPIPISLLSQYFPMQLEAIRSDELAADPQAIIANCIERVIERYSKACGS